MAVRTDSFDLGRLRLSSGEGRRLTLGVAPGSFDYGGTQYAAEPAQVATHFCPLPADADCGRTISNVAMIAKMRPGMEFPLNFFGL